MNKIKSYRETILNQIAIIRGMNLENTNYKNTFILYF